MNALSAALWAGGIGGAASLIGPSVIDWVNEAGVITTAAIVVIVGAVVVEEVRRRRRKQARERP